MQSLNAGISKAILTMSLVAAALLASDCDAFTSLTDVDQKNRGVANFMCDDLKEAERIPLSSAWTGCTWGDVLLPYVKSQDGPGDKKVYRATLTQLVDRDKNKVFYFEYAFHCGTTPKTIAVHYYPEGHCEKAKEDGGKIWNTMGMPTTWGSQTFEIHFNYRTRRYWPMVSVQK